MTTTVPDVETLDHLEFTPACQLVGCRDDRPPATHVLRPTCGCAVPTCTPCAAYLTKHADHVEPLWRCLQCGRHLGGGRLGDVARIEPLP